MTTTHPWILVRVEQILARRRRHNTSWQNGEDIAHIIAALTAQHPEMGAQQELFT